MKAFFRLHPPHGLDSGLDLSVEVLEKAGGGGNFCGLEGQKHHGLGKDIPEPSNDLLVLCRRKKMDGVTSKQIESFHESFQGSGMKNVFEARIQNLIFPDSFSPYRQKEVEILHNVKMTSLMRNTFFLNETFEAGMAVGNNAAEDIAVLS